MGTKLRKFLLLMWKNWLLQYRKPIQTLIEILAPVLFSILLVLIRSLVDPEPHDAVIYNPFCTFTPPSNMSLSILSACNVSNSGSNLARYLKKMKQANSGEDDSDSVFGTYELIYSPQNDDVDEIMNAITLLNIFKDVKAFNNSESLIAYYTTQGSKNIFAGISFDGHIIGNTNQRNKSTISLRFPAELRSTSASLEQNDWRTNLIYPVYQSSGPRTPENQTGATPNYFLEGFLALQHGISFLVILHQKGILTNMADISSILLNDDVPKLPFIYMNRFPYANWQDDPLLTPLKSFVGIIFMLSFVYTCINTVKAITAEKEKQLKEAMKIMGLPNWLHWTAWFLKTFSYLIVSIILMVIMLKVRWYKNTDFTVFTYANPMVILLFLFFYICATITFCFCISVFFSKANTAATIAGLAWFLSYAPYGFMQQNYEFLSLSTKLGTSLGANTAMAFGFQLILMFEGTGEGVQWNNIWRTITPDDNLTLGHLMTMLVLDCFIYLLIALYVEAIFPGDYGIPQPWYFPFLKSYWCGKNYIAVEDLNPSSPNSSEFFESEPNLNVGIQIKNLRKVFGNKAAVRNLSLNMYEDQITVLLGHNGAGKTTTMSMLTGMFPPTGGTALVNGYDIRTDIDGVRNSLGLCPQHNIIFDDLTVEEHLYFFSGLKGLRGQEVKDEIDKYVELLELQPKRKHKSSTLSGGMKRKLCVGIALCGKSKVVMLDEPTAGMDPSARRALWDLLLKQKSGRTLLLTTHFMDEADLLGDRIAIMAGGELQCCGSSFFLKKKYGAGYHLIMDKSVHCDPAKVTNLLRQYIPTIEVHSNIGSELTYLLVESQSYLFEKMLKELENHSQQLGVNSYGISLTTLEEVFMKVGADHGQEELYNSNDLELNEKTVFENLQTKVDVNLAPQQVSNTKFLINQFLAMAMKKVLSTFRSWVLLVIQIFMPVIFLVLAIVMVRQQSQFDDLPAMPLTIDKFDSPVVLVQGNNNPYQNIYENNAGRASQTVNSIVDTMLQVTKNTPSTAKRSYVVGAQMEDIPSNTYFDTKLTAYFNNDPYHTPGVTLGLALDATYQKILNCTNCGLEFVNHPLPYSSESKINQISTGNNMGFQLAFNISFSMAFVSSFYILFIVRERVCNSKHLQFVSGVKAYVFWITTLLWDYLTYLITVIALVITLVCFQEDGFKTCAEVGRLFAIFAYFGWSMLPMMYIAGYLFDVPSTGYTRMTLFSIFTGVAAFLIVQVLATPGLDLEHIGNALHWVFLTVPHYSLATGIRDTYTLYYYNKICNDIYEQCLIINSTITYDECIRAVHAESYCSGLDEHYYKWESPGIGRNVLFSFSVGLVLFIGLLVAEYEIFSRIIFMIRQKWFPKYPITNPEEDSDVVAERAKITDTPEPDLFHSYTMVLKNLTKYYGKFLAVNGLHLGVKKYECFGLLGINGAGKTTTFKMLTGDVWITRGDAWINGRSIKSNIKEVHKCIGYCPQFDALLDDMTARETLVMFSLLRGIPYDYCNLIAEKLATDFDYYRHLEKRVKELSGGNKRKLSTSIALIGDPPVIYLDEPTTGMDPATKRYLWNALCKVRDSGKTIVLTSHSMEECEALCTRLAIMVNGNFKCLGSTQHLKNKFAEGYTLTIKIKKTERSGSETPHNTNDIEGYIKEYFPKAILREKHDELLTYYVMDKSIPWSRMFGILEEGKKREQLNIEDYSLGQSSLEQVFLTFTKHQQ
ncbi:ATP binding cassette subfamily A member 3 isoform X2 [Rhynchophorus ferrugineus]